MEVSSKFRSNRISKALGRTRLARQNFMLKFKILPLERSNMPISRFTSPTAMVTLRAVSVISIPWHYLDSNIGKASSPRGNPPRLTELGQITRFVYMKHSFLESSYIYIQNTFTLWPTQLYLVLYRIDRVSSVYHARALRKLSGRHGRKFRSRHMFHPQFFCASADANIRYSRFKGYQKWGRMKRPSQSPQSCMSIQHRPKPSYYNFASLSLQGNKIKRIGSMGLVVLFKSLTTGFEFLSAER